MGLDAHSHINLNTVQRWGCNLQRIVNYNKDNTNIAFCQLGIQFIAMCIFLSLAVADFFVE
jgi:hypothetical protein